MDPLLSFVVPTKNREEWLGECLMSLLAQDVNEIEIIIVDDGSTDGTNYLLDWAKKDPRVKVLRNEESIGAGPSRNKGMEAATAPIIAVCDDDDMYPDGRARVILDWFAKHPESNLVNFPYVNVGYFNEEIEKFDGKPFDEKLFKEHGVVTYFSNPTVAYRKEPVMAMGGYPKETREKTDDVQFLKNWIDAGEKVDFDDKYYMAYHRVLPESMMVPLRGWKPEWATKNG